MKASFQAACFRLPRTLPVVVLWWSKLMAIFREQGKMVPSMLFSDSGRIFLKRDIQHPMQTVFYRPVLAYGRYLPLIFDGHAGQKIPLFCRNASIRFALPNRFHR